MSNKAATAAIAAVVLAAFLFLGFYVVDAGVESSYHDISIENESFTPVGGELSVFENSNLNRATYEETVTVRNASSEDVFLESGNYTWYEGNGTLKTTTNSDLANTSTATITYNYTGQTLKQTKLTNMVVRFMGILVPLAFVGFVAFLGVSMFVLGRVA